MTVQCLICEAESEELSEADEKTLRESLEAAEERGNPGFIACQLCLMNYQREKLGN